ncbi:MAG: MFS transporter [Chloroflexia bacterium]|nr:MFS transporter [Chloroflexia bacterium]
MRNLWPLGGGRYYYGWVVAGTLAVTETISWGVFYYAFSVFLIPMERELGWSPAVLTGAFSVALLVSGVSAPFVGRWVDRHGGRLLMSAGAALGVVLLLAWSRVELVPIYYLLWVGMGLVLATSLYEPAFAVVTAWFERGRGRALLLLTIVAGFASTIFLPLTAWLVERMGWREALVALAVLVAVTTLPAHALILRRRPADLGLQVDGAAAPDADDAGPAAVAGMEAGVALRDPGFWLLATAFFLGMFATVAVGVHLIPYLILSGYSAGFAATVTGLIGAMQVASRVVVTMVGGRWPQVWILAIVLALQSLALAVLLVWNQPVGVIVAVILLGAGRGAMSLMRATIVGERYGRTHFGAINGTLALFVSGAAAMAPVGAGLAYAAADSYRPVFAGLAAATLLAALAALSLGSRPALR